jgi:hypothetical protein
MFLNPIWSFMLIALAAGVYAGYVRPRLRAMMPNLYADFDSAWARAWAIVTKFKKTFAVIAGIVITALPDILVQFTPLDFSKFLPEGHGHWAAIVGPTITAIVLIMRGIEAANAAKDASKTGG